MRIRLIGVLAALLVTGSVHVPATIAQTSPPMEAFPSDTELVVFLKQRSARQRRTSIAVPAPLSVPMPPPPPPPSATPPAGEPAAAADGAAPTGTPSITNTQETDVDEGGIVKMHRGHLVVLRRGRLFTVSLGDRSMRATDRIDAFPPGTSGTGAWYDEMLISGDRVIVVGYSYERGGTEINRFRIDDAGRLRFEASYHLRSNDYYSSSNYASRLIGDKLIFYTPLGLSPYAPIAGQLPALSRWTGQDKSLFRRIAPATRIYVPAPVRRDPFAAIDTLHTVTTCDLAAEEVRCDAVGVLGSGSRNFYVSGNAVYVWTGGTLSGGRSLVYRLPLDGSRPGATRAWGAPVDQFSFREDRAGQALDVVVRADSRGERMWRAEVSEGDAALLHLSLGLFGDGSALAAARAYRSLPLNRQPNWSFHNRFVGQYLVYSAGEFAATAGVKTVFAAPLDGGPIAQIAAPHGVDRIDIMGSDAVVIGNDARLRLGFTAIELVGAAPRIGDTSFLPPAREGERRSQAFFYHADPASPDGASGTLGLPVTRDLASIPAARFLGSGSAVAFLRRDARRFTPAGALDAHAEGARDDGCQASCIDWYGNARPIFLGDRVFALMGYELVEGRLERGQVREIGRLDFAPTASGGTASSSPP